MNIQNLVPLSELDAKAPEDTEEAIALEFAERHGKHLRYVAAWGRWMVYDAGRWAKDDTVDVFDKARHLCRAKSAALAKVLNNQSLVRKLATAATASAIEKLARSDRRHAATVDQWDADPWLLNTPEGTVDLRTGKSRDHCPDDYMTLQTAVAPAGECPLWLSFLDRVTDGDNDLISYLQRLTGYSLTGSTREHVLGNLHGTGANGKTVFINAVAGVFGDYHKTAPMEVFTASTFDRHPTELAMLRGPRLITATETESGKGWKEARIKALTGGDIISARFMRQDFFEFEPVFKLLIAGNHKPPLRKVDEAIRRRFHMIPFTVTIPKNERDEELPEKLRAEWPGILRWAVEGTAAWLAEGLNPPKAVRDTTEEYLSGEDAFGQWLAETCEVGTQYSDSTANLFDNFRRYAEKIGEHAGSRKEFKAELEGRGFVESRTARSRGFDGLKTADRVYRRNDDDA